MKTHNLNAHDFACLAEDLLWSGRNIAFTARGSSMSPLIKDKDTVEIQPISKMELRIGDIVLYKTASGAVRLHRICVLPLSVSTDSAAIIAGNSYKSCLEKTSVNRILGRLTNIDRNGKRFIVPDTLPQRVFTACRTVLRCYMRSLILKWTSGVRSARSMIICAAASSGLNSNS